MVPSFRTVMKGTEDGGSDRKDAELAGIMFKHLIESGPQSTIREFSPKLQASRLVKSETRTVKSATVAVLERVLKKSLGYGIEMVLTGSP